MHAHAYADTSDVEFREGVAAPTSDGSKTVAEVSEHWMAQRRHVRSSHRYQPAGALRTWVIPRFGFRAAGSIKRSEVQDFANDLQSGRAVANEAEQVRKTVPEPSAHSPRPLSSSLVG